MFKKWLSVCVVLAAFAGAVAQDYPLLWQDDFEDFATDPAALYNVGWFYYGESDGLFGQLIQEQEGYLLMQAGNYAGLVGAAIVETNGIPALDTTNEAQTRANLILNNFSSPNQILTFAINFTKITASFFAVSTRMVQMDTSESMPDADPTASPGYALFINPTGKGLALARYEGDLTVLNPTLWTYFGQAGFNFELDVWYMMKLLVDEGNMKVKIWEGDITMEPAEWLLEGTDPSPRVEGNFTAFGLLAPGNPPLPGQGDQVKLDDIVMTSSRSANAVNPDAGIPREYSLDQNYPNPFNPDTRITFSLPKKEMTSLVIYNTLGQAVRTLVASDLAAGSHTYTWDGMDDSGQAVTSGIYVYRLNSGDHSESKRMVLMR